MTPVASADRGGVVRERPILFSAPMVRAILAGQKTQTRRVVKPQPPSNMHRHCWFDAPVYAWTYEPEPAAKWHRVRCPYGVPDDRLWVRETWASPEIQIVAYKADAECGAWMGDGGGGRIWIRHGLIHESPYYMQGRFPADTRTLRKYGGRWRPSIHMPRWASRITLEILSVRVERLQEITEEDAIAEGVESAACAARPGKRVYRDYYLDKHDPFEWYADPRRSYESLWDRINGKRGYPWVSNPWVWAVEFRRVEGTGACVAGPDSVSVGGEGEGRP